MKRFVLSLALLAAGAIAFAPAASAEIKRQRNTAVNLSEGGVTELVQYNRDARDKK